MQGKDIRERAKGRSRTRREGNWHTVKAMSVKLEGHDGESRCLELMHRERQNRRGRRETLVAEIIIIYCDLSCQLSRRVEIRVNASSPHLGWKQDLRGWRNDARACRSIRSDRTAFRQSESKRTAETRANRDKRASYMVGAFNARQGSSRIILSPIGSYRRAGRC